MCKKKLVNTWMPSGKFIDESIKTASWIKLISNLQCFVATYKKKLYLNEKKKNL